MPAEPEKYEEQVKKQTEIERHLARVQKTLEFFKSYGWTDNQVTETIGDIYWRIHPELTQWHTHRGTMR